MKSESDLLFGIAVEIVTASRIPLRPLRAKVARCVHSAMLSMMCKTSVAYCRGPQRHSAEDSARDEK